MHNLKIEDLFDVNFDGEGESDVAQLLEPSNKPVSQANGLLVVPALIEPILTHIPARSSVYHKYN